jgi:DnaJ-class molecular chaperone
MPLEFDIKKNYYLILGIEPNASLEEIKAAHIKLGWNTDIYYF